MRYRLLVMVFCLALTGQLGLCAEPPPPPDPNASPNPTKDAKADAAKAEQAKADPFDFAGQKKSTAEESQFIEVDETLKVSVDPVVHNAVVDRVIERSTIYVKAPSAVRVEFYLQAVDGPYCGKSLGDPRLLGQSRDGQHNFPVAWNRPEASRYVKVYALAYKKNGQAFTRSRSIDLSMGGDRLQPAPQSHGLGTPVR